LTGLDSETGYTIYVVVEDQGGNASEVMERSFTTRDVTDPEISSPATTSLTSTSVSINFRASEAGRYYFVVSFASDGDKDEDQIRLGDFGVAINGLNTIPLNGLTSERAYFVHILLRDAQGNFSQISRVEFTTPAVQINGGGSSGNDISDLVIEKRINNYYLAKMNDNISRLRTTIRGIFEANAFIAANFNAQSTTFMMDKPNHIEFINQIIRNSGVEKFNELISATQKTTNDSSFDAAFEKVYGQSIADWYLNSAAPGFVTSIMDQGSNSLLKEIINFELLRALSSGSGSEASLQIMGSSMQRVLRDLLATDAGLQKLQDLVDSSKNTSDDSVRQSAFERVYGTSFTRWMETKAITWVKEALGIPNFQSGRLAAPKSSTTKVQPEKATGGLLKITRSWRDRAFHV
jgi:hypothetical protein